MLADRAFTMVAPENVRLVVDETTSREGFREIEGHFAEVTAAGTFGFANTFQRLLA